MQIRLNDRLLDLSVPAVMGIVNVTPDSFYAGSRHGGEADLLRTVGRMVAEGAALIDLGGYSSRPSAADVPPDEELRRLAPALEAIRREFPDLPVSVDTFRASVARRVVEDYGVAMINDIGGGTLDPDMFSTVASLGVAYVLMHMRGTPATMNTLTRYDNLTAEVTAFLGERLAELHRLGVNDVVVDPGFGFAKTVEQNYRLLRELPALAVLDAPLLVGVSRKRMVYELLETDAARALNGTTAVHMLALAGGAHILRVHDVREAVEAVRVYEAWLN